MLPQKLAPARLPILCGVIGLSILAVFKPVLTHEFVAWDDDINVYENPLLNPATSRSVAQFWRGPYLRLYIPLTYTAWVAAAEVSQRRTGPMAPLSPEPFHAANLGIHILNGLMAFALLRRLLRAARPSSSTDEKTGAELDVAALAGSLVFSLHPVQVEPVAWVSGLRDVLSGLGTLCALEQYVAFAVAPRGAKRALHYAAATGAFVAALLSKPSAVVIPLMAGIIDYGVLARPVKKIAASAGGWLLLAMGSALMTQAAQGATHIRALTPLWARPLIAADSLAFYLGKLAWPRALSPDYGRPPDLVMREGWCYWTWLAPAALAAAIAVIRERRIWVVCGGLFVAAMFPVLGFVPFLHQDLSTVADRYVYLSMIGPALALAWLLARPGTARNWRWAAAALLVAGLGWRSRLQAQVWKNTGALFGHIVALNPDSGVAHLNLGNYLAGQGKLEEARFHFQETLRLRSGDGLALNNLGNLMARQGKLDEAVAYYTQALGNGVPDNVLGAHYALGIIAASRGKTEEAARHYAEALRINPDSAKVHSGLAALLIRQGRLDEAMVHLDWALRVRPKDPEAHKNLGLILAEKGRLEEARLQYALGMEVPADSMEAYGGLCDSLQVRDRFAAAAACYQDLVRRTPAMAEAYNSLGYTLARQGRLAEAVRQYREAVRLKPGYMQAQLNLGATLLQMGQAEEAISAWTRALAADPGAVEIHHNLGVLLLQRGKKEEAIAHLKAALRLRPNFEPSRRLLTQIAGAR